MLGKGLSRAPPTSKMKFFVDQERHRRYCGGPRYASAWI